MHRRVAQWYVPGLEREHRHPPGTAAPVAPAKISTVVAEAVNVALTGTNKTHHHNNNSTPVDQKEETPAETTAKTVAEAGAVGREETPRTETAMQEGKAEEVEKKAAAGDMTDTPNAANTAATSSSSSSAAIPQTAEAASAKGNGTSTLTRGVGAAPEVSTPDTQPASPERGYTTTTTTTDARNSTSSSTGLAASTHTAAATAAGPASDFVAAPPPPPLTSLEEKAKDAAATASTTATTTAAAAAASPSPATLSGEKAEGRSDTKEGPKKSGEKDRRKSTEEEEGGEEDDDDDDEELPKTLLTVQANRNKRMKRLLMASLGSDFAKAGLSNDGVRTSFSVVNYQTIKQLTGLSRIPSTLLISCLVAPGNEFSWVDISMHPTATLSEYKEALEEVLLGLGMHRTMVEDSAEPMLLPQVTVAKGCYSLLMRYAIEAPANKQMDSFQDLTNRFTVFLSQGRIITVHRTQCSYVEELKLNWQHHLSQDNLDGTPQAHRGSNTASNSKKSRGNGSGLTTTSKSGGLTFSEIRSSSSGSNNSGESTAAATTPRGLRYLMYYFVKETVGTFTQAIAKCIVEFDRYEANLFNTQRNRSSMARDIYHIKRRASVYGRTLTLTQDAYAHIATALHISSSQVGYQEIMHDLAHVESLAEELNSNADSVLQLLFQLSSYQVNELMRVLTVFSAFFIPLSFIASVYGMNFEDLPMLHNEYGGVFCAMLMCTVATCIFMWFRFNRFI